MNNIGAIFIFLLSMLRIGSAQVVTEDVHFDYYQTISDNDFVNHFSGGNGLTQLQNSGITGGCLSTPDSINWGNDNAYYCSRYHALQGGTTTTSVCFKFDPTNIHPGSYERAASIWLVPDADFNHYVFAAITNDQKIEIISYSWVNNPYPLLALIQDHWYNFVLTASFTGGISHTVYVNAVVFDIGLNGLAAPSLVNSSSGTFSDSIVIADSSIHVAITGTTYGGAVYLDDFHFEGNEGFTNCINAPVGISYAGLFQPIKIYPVPARTSIYVECNEQPTDELSICIYNFLGEKILGPLLIQNKTELNVSSLPPGIYFLHCRAYDISWSEKFVIEK